MGAALPHVLQALRVNCTHDSLLLQPHGLQLEHCTQLTRLEMWTGIDADRPTQPVQASQTIFAE